MMFGSSFRVGAFSIAMTTAVSAGPLSGQKEISLVDVAGNRVVIADVTFRPDPYGATYDIAWKDELFANHFLSMRPFQCLEGAKKYWCRVPYPYQIRRVVSPSDLTDLEYDTLFLWKGASEYGINMWNGVYYRLEAKGDRLVGTLHEMDMGLLSAPPDVGDLRPVEAGDLHEADPESHWLPHLVIE